MILEVPFDQFAATVNRVLKTRDVYTLERGSHVVVSAASAVLDTIVASFVIASIADVRAQLTEAQFDVFPGAWHTENLMESVFQSATPYVAAVAYVSQERIPGLWVDAYSSAPAVGIVLKNLYEEFKTTGQIADVSFDEFVRLAQPNVVTISPEELHRYVEENSPC